MTGVEILAMEEVATEFAFNWTAFAIVFCLFFVIFGFTGFIISKNTDDWKQLLIGLIVGASMGAFAGLITGSVFRNPIEYEHQYKVIISDEVSMNDFFEKYEIIDTEGKIYTVAERD